MKVIILGASADPAKFGNKAVRAFARAGWEVVPVNPGGVPVAGFAGIRNLAQAPRGADVLSVYLPPRVTMGLLDDFAAAGPREVWLNPGAETPEVTAALRERGLTVRELCSIVELGFSPSMFP